MTANELRIGNLIYRKGGSEIFLDGIPEIKHPDIVVEVKTIFSDNGIDGVNASWNGDRYVFDPPLWNTKPIPLTEEWLVKAGFELSSRSSIITYYNNQFNICIEIFSNGCIIVDDIVEVKYIHSLQNLYFALTGEELNFANVK